MRVAFWRAGKGRAVEQAPTVERDVAKPEPAAYAPVASSVAGDIDLRAVGQALRRKKRWIILPTLLALGLSIVAVNYVTREKDAQAVVDAALGG